jgi:signal transduction histidine kinase
MKLAVFIQSNMENIAAEWELFAATLLPDEEFSKSILRDGIFDMLVEIADDMKRSQSDEQQQVKSEGEPRRYLFIDGAAERHALARVQMGLSSRQVISEFRALRATVIRQWQRHSPDIDERSLYDLTRFNEAIDQALTEAAIRYTMEIDRSRELFLGILGHDLRNPLAAISLLAQVQLRAKTIEKCRDFASKIQISARRMSHLITDLVELTRVRLGTGILINPAHTTIRSICTSAIEEMQAIHPDRVFHLDCDEDIPGEWDEARMSQVLSNLLGNAVQHGARRSPVTLTAYLGDTGVELAVHNDGPAIPPHLVPKLFDCMFQGTPMPKNASDASTSLGLGLYIAKEIITAQGGTIDVYSTDAEGTTFIARLPHPTPPAVGNGNTIGAAPAGNV